MTDLLGTVVGLGALLFAWFAARSSTPEWRFNRIARRVERLVRRKAKRFNPPISWSQFYGAVGINPKHLVFWYIFRTDSRLVEARRSGLTDQLESWTRAGLARYRYPAEAIPNVAVDFASDEQIKAAGGYREFFA